MIRVNRQDYYYAKFLKLMSLFNREMTISDSEYEELKQYGLKKIDEDSSNFDIDIANFDLYEEGNTNRLNNPGTDLEPHDWSWHKAAYSVDGSYGSRDCIEVKNTSISDGGENKPSLYIYLKPENITVGSKTYPCKACLLYSKKMFGQGQIDIKAKMMHLNNAKSTIWGTSAVMNRELSTLNVNKNKTTNNFTEGPKRTFKYLYEFDVCEYTPSDASQGDYGTNRAIWVWQENKQSILYGSAAEKNDPWVRVDVEDNLTTDGLKHGWQNNMISYTGLQSEIDPLPWLFFGEDGEPHSLSAGFWNPQGATGNWYLGYYYMICYDGNKLKGHKTGCYYFIKNYVKEVVETVNGKEVRYPKVVRDTDAVTNVISDDCLIASQDLHWIKYNPTDKTITEGSGMDGNDWFYAPTDISVSSGLKPHAVGTGNNIVGQLNSNNIYISDWHTWSINANTNGIKFMCDNYAYLDINRDVLYPLLPTDDYAFGLIFSTVRPADYVYNNLMPPNTGYMIISDINFTSENTNN